MTKLGYTLLENIHSQGKAQMLVIVLEEEQELYILKSLFLGELNT